MVDRVGVWQFEVGVRLVDLDKVRLEQATSDKTSKHCCAVENGRSSFDFKGGIARRRRWQ
jgi:hypothetical protein